MVKASYFKGLGIFYLISLLFSLLLLSCSKNDETAYEDEAQSTAAAVAKIYRACKYDNENFCDIACCKAEQRCNNNFAYKECDLETGEWKESLYSDSNCITFCEEEKFIDELDENAEINETYYQTINYTNTTLCKEGWKCRNGSIAGYLLPDCAWTSVKFCDNGCFNGTCIPLCKPGTFICDKNNSRVCDDDGNHWGFYKECEYGCKDGLCIEINTTIFNNTNLSQNNQTLNNLTNLTQPNNSTLNITQPNNSTNQTNTNQSSQNDFISDHCMSVLKYNLTGVNPTNEYVMLKNSCSYNIDMSSWTASDDANHIYTFPSFNLANDGEVTIVTGNGSDNQTTLYWGRGSAVWNNGGDTLYLNTSNGTSVLIEALSP